MLQGQLQSTLNPVNAVLEKNPLGVGLTVFAGLLSLSYFIAIVMRLRAKNKNQSNFKFNTVWFITFVLFSMLTLDTFLGTIPRAAMNLVMLSLLFTVIYTALD